jgi:RNA polymerase sigma-70 factor (ECF subfamily)
MGNDASSRTSATLLGRLRTEPQDAAAWATFVRSYAPLIAGWCRHWGLKEADSDDVSQEVLLRLLRRLRTFEYDPARSFRGWLRTLTHHAWSDFLDAERHHKAIADSELLRSLEARDDLLARLEGQFDRELLEEAMSRVRPRVKPHTWEAFRLTELEGLTAEAAAQQLGIRVTAAFKAKSRVKDLIRKEVRRLNGD